MTPRYHLLHTGPARRPPAAGTPDRIHPRLLHCAHPEGGGSDGLAAGATATAAGAIADESNEGGGGGTAEALGASTLLLLAAFTNFCCLWPTPRVLLAALPALQ